MYYLKKFLKQQQHIPVAYMRMIPWVSFVALQLLGKNPQRYTIYNHLRQLCVCIHMTVYTYMLYGTHLQLFTAIVFLIIF